MKFGDMVYWLEIADRKNGFGPDYDILHSGRVINFDDDSVCLSYEGGTTTGVYEWRATHDVRFLRRSLVHSTADAAKASLMHVVRSSSSRPRAPASRAKVKPHVRSRA